MQIRFGLAVDRWTRRRPPSHSSGGLQVVERADLQAGSRGGEEGGKYSLAKSGAAEQTRAAKSLVYGE